MLSLNNLINDFPMLIELLVNVNCLSLAKFSFAFSKFSLMYVSNFCFSDAHSTSNLKDILIKPYKYSRRCTSSTSNLKDILIKLGNVLDKLFLFFS